jgi:hypothetical protein
MTRHLAAAVAVPITYGRMLVLSQKRHEARRSVVVPVPAPTPSGVLAGEGGFPNLRVSRRTQIKEHLP